MKAVQSIPYDIFCLPPLWKFYFRLLVYLHEIAKQTYFIGQSNNADIAYL